MTKHNHSFAVDASCECGIALSTLIRSQAREIERLETALTRWQTIHDALIDVLEGRATTDDHTLVVAIKQLHERLEARVREAENVKDQFEARTKAAETGEHQAEQERDCLAEKVRELEGELPGKLKGERALADEQIRCFHEQAVNVEQERDRLLAEVKAYEGGILHDHFVAQCQKTERLREQYNKVLGAIDEGLVEDDADLATASVIEMHETVNRLRDQVKQYEQQFTITPEGFVMSADGAQAYERLRGLIGALPLLQEFDRIDYYSGNTAFLEALAALLKARQEMT